MKRLLFFMLSFAVLFGCEEGKERGESAAAETIRNMSTSDLKILSGKKIYFGHMSVGGNIVEGLRDILARFPGIALNIVETKNLSDFDRPVFAHSPLGTNGDPASKIEAFLRLMDGGFGRKADIAFFKLCYIDILSATDADEVFRRYNTAMRGLRERYPKVTFVHVTVPLRVVQTGFKVPIKKLFGRPVGGYADNMKRGRYNELLRQEYKGKEPLFDLAAIESTFPGGGRALFENGGKTYEALVPDYTNDGGHLNEDGRRVVAGRLLQFLAALAD